MPIYEHTYRPYDAPEAPRRHRWWPIICQEVRVLLSKRTFVALVILGSLLFAMRIMQIVAMTRLSSNPNSPMYQIYMMIKSIEYLRLGPSLFFDFIRMQAPVVFVASLFAGAGMICDDVRYNLLPIYFSKPLSWRDYVMGKAATLVLIGLALTAAPALILLILTLALDPTYETLVELYWMPLPIVTFSLAVVLPCALGVLASSALFNSQRYAAIALFMVLFANLTLGQVLPEVLHKPGLGVIAFPLAVNRVGEAVFRDSKPAFRISWQVSLVFVLLVCAVTWYIIRRRARREEAAA